MKVSKILGAVFVCGVCTLAASAQQASFKSTAKHERRLAQQQANYEESVAKHPVQDYLDMKQKLADATGLQYGFDVSYLIQRGAPSGKQTSVQGYYYPYITWNLFKDARFGSGQFNANYTLIRYWGMTGSTLQNRLGLLAGQNDDLSNSESFNQFSYTHTLPGDLNWLSFTVGQFPLYNFDGTNYLDNQQMALFNYAMSQNASSTYPTASFGGYVQAAPGDWTFAAGYQDASNVSGQNIKLNKAFDGYYTWFGSVSYTPTIKGLGAGQYSFLYYYQPSVPLQAGISRGWSVNISQDFGDTWVLSARANGSDGNIAAVKNSYALAASLVNPFDRNVNDAITLGVAYNRADKEALGYPTFYRKNEMAIELQYVIGLGKLVTVTPDIQVYPKSALGDRFTTVAGLRTTIML